MRTSIVLCMFFSFSHSAQLHIKIEPDTIFVGTLAKIRISIKDLDHEEISVFPDIPGISDKYSIRERILYDNSVDYTLQFWETGFITIESLPVLIKKNNQEIIELWTDLIEISVLTNINGNNRALRSIKSMHQINIRSSYQIICSFLLILIGLGLAFYFWKTSKSFEKNKSKFSLYTKYTLQETIKCIKSLTPPDNINIKSTERFYLDLSKIVRKFINDMYFIRATEMTSDEIKEYFQSIGLDKNVIDSWSKINEMTDIVKYAGQVPELNQFYEDRNDFIQLIKSFNMHNLQ